MEMYGYGQTWHNIFYKNMCIGLSVLFKPKNIMYGVSTQNLLLTLCYNLIIFCTAGLGLFFYVLDSIFCSDEGNFNTHCDILATESPTIFVALVLRRPV